MSRVEQESHVSTTTTTTTTSNGNTHNKYHQSSSRESSKSLLPDVSGSWKVRDISNLDGLLAEAGAPWIVRKLLKNSFAKASMTINQQGSIIYVEDKTNLGQDGKPAHLKFVEGVDNIRKDNWGFTLTEICQWDFDTIVESFVWTLKTYGYFNNKFGPVVSRYYFDKNDKDVYDTCPPRNRVPCVNRRQRTRRSQGL